MWTAPADWLLLRLAGHAVRLDCPDPELHALLSSRLSDLCVEGPAAITAVVQVQPEGAGFDLLQDGQQLFRAVNRAMACDHVVAWCNAHAARTAVDTINIHAAAVVAPGTDRTMLIAAPSGSGKSTVASALVRRGWGYLSDEMASLHRSSDHVHGYPKPLTFKVGTRDLLQADGVDLPSVADPQSRWYARPDELGGYRLNTGRLHGIVIASHDPDTPTALLSAGPVAALMGLIGNAQSTLDTEGTDLAHLARLASTCHTLQLIHNNLDEAAELLAAVAAKPAPTQPTDPIVTRVPGGERLPAHHRARAGVLSAHLADGAVLFDPAQQRLLALDVLAAAIWPELDGQRSLAELAAECADLFAAPLAVVQHDLDRLVADLTTEGFVEPPAPG